MTDAALPVTERAVEEIADAYLRSVGADVAKDGRRWSVTLPANADTDLNLESAVLEVASDPSEVSEDAYALAPGSAFVERLLDEAAGRTPVGAMSLTAEDTELRDPEWLTAGSVDVVDRTFTPYYDRRAVCALFHVGIETVSEYQTEALHAVAVDLTDQERRPRLAERYLELVDERRVPREGELVDEQTITTALDAAGDALETEIQPTVREARERATRAAEVELEEYREFVQQRRDELAAEIDRLGDRIEEATATIDATTEQSERVEALRERKALRVDLEDVRAEHDDVTDQIEAGFPEQRRDVRERHSLTVRIEPVTATTVTYERGELELELRATTGTAHASYAYAVGTGVLDEPDCSQCGRQLTAANPVSVAGGRIVGDACCGE